MEENKILEIAKYYGKIHQTDKTVEELSELIRALSKKDVTNIIEEIADVEIMLEQIKFLYNLNPNDIYNEKQFKIERTLEKIKGV